MADEAPSQWQYAVTAWVPLVTGHMSVFGSGWIIWHVLCGKSNASTSSDRRRRGRNNGTAAAAMHNSIKHSPNWNSWLRQKLKQKPHLRLLLAMSVYDVIGSISQAWAFVMSPKNISGWDGSRGNMTSCRAQGFLIQIGFGVSVYNALLSLFYYLTICHNLRMETWWKLEKVFHILTFLTMATMAVVGLSLDLYNPVYAYCFISPYPPGCELCEGCPPCESTVTPSNVGLMVFIFGQWLAQLCLVTVIVTNYLIWKRVRSQLKRMSRYEIQPSSIKAESSGVETVNTPTTATDSNPTDKTTKPESSNPKHPFQHLHKSPLSRRESQRRRSTSRERMVFQQCFALTLGFIICYIGPASFSLGLWIADYRAFWQTFLLVTLTPLHGVLNFAIYSRPLYVQVRNKFGQHLTTLQLFHCVYFFWDPMGAAAQKVQAQKEKQSNALPQEQQQRLGQELHEDPILSSTGGGNSTLRVDDPFDAGHVDVVETNSSNEPPTVKSSSHATTEPRSSRPAVSFMLSSEHTDADANSPTTQSGEQGDASHYVSNDGSHGTDDDQDDISDCMSLGKAEET